MVAPGPFTRRVSIPIRKTASRGPLIKDPILLMDSMIVSEMPPTKNAKTRHTAPQKTVSNLEMSSSIRPDSSIFR